MVSWRKMAKFTEVLDTIKTALKRHLNAVLTASPRQVLTHTVVFIRGKTKCTN